MKKIILILMLGLSLQAGIFGSNDKEHWSIKASRNNAHVECIGGYKFAITSIAGGVGMGITMVQIFEDRLDKNVPWPIKCTPEVH